jgi:hypothetical protein
MPKVAVNPLKTLDKTATQLGYELCGHTVRGAECPSIIGKGIQIIEKAASFGVFGARMDKLRSGHDIVYWPDLKWGVVFADEEPDYEGSGDWEGDGGDPDDGDHDEHDYGY